MPAPRTATVHRETAETGIRLSLSLDGSGRAAIATGIPFFDHMLTLFARHGLFDLEVEARGDLAVDYHHTVEDTGLVLGQALKTALGDKRGIHRYGSFFVPMDDALARAVIDLSNRPFLVYQAGLPLPSPLVRDFNIHLLKEFYQAFANEAGANVHLCAEYGLEAHHVAEAMMKAFARALGQAVALDPRQAGSIPSTKGIL